ncbi:hypothetical protein PF005_g13550 [Phytophthora fragariae]|uniref:Uncharacterized protein n=1 Tax=Phytophthora fragariae TaxID=53985 RepID=A0A6A3XR88_9STRA|nr:hypothetical protein PF011_g18578 [Phytophthora fragariae]KAE9204013.1 hypothetical protein PF002_g20764 [Phytophthora fragariae]KAE9205094.1 hypothetical protein PF005_g13550 [Phytophthora fragariae]
MPVTLNMGIRMPTWNYVIKSLVRMKGDNADGIDASPNRVVRFE